MHKITFGYQITDITRSWENTLIVAVYVVLWSLLPEIKRIMMIGHED